MNLLDYVNDKLAHKSKLPSFRAGDTVTVSYKIKEGDKERIQEFTGVVIQIKGTGTTKTFTVRKISNGVGVERIFPINSPYIDAVEVTKKGDVRRSRLFYLRELTGKKARIQERKLFTQEEEKTPAPATA
ncbi:MAG TPA: 50S ribosomal protein L19 [Bacteroidia bacterium]|jgi:large subunit ribosomal protein L19